MVTEFPQSHIPQYKYTTKEVEINGKKYKANFVKPHSRIKGIIYEWYDRNADDYPWANRSDWRLEAFFILWKNNTEWEKIDYNAFSNTYHICWWHSTGLNEILFALETDKFKNKWNKEKRIVELKSRIKKDSKELSQLLKG